MKTILHISLMLVHFLCIGKKFIAGVGWTDSRGSWLVKGGCERNWPDWIYKLKQWSEDRNHLSCAWLVLDKSQGLKRLEFSLEASYSLAVCSLLSCWKCSPCGAIDIQLHMSLPSVWNSSVLVLMMFYLLDHNACSWILIW